MLLLFPFLNNVKSIACISSQKVWLNPAVTPSELRDFVWLVSFVVVVVFIFFSDGFYQYKFDTGPSFIPTASRLRKASHHREWVPKSQLMCQRYILFPLAGAPQTDQPTTLSPTWRGYTLVSCRLSSCVLFSDLLCMCLVPLFPEPVTKCHCFSSKNQHRKEQ